LRVGQKKSSTMPDHIPGPRGLPLLGNVADIDPSDAVASLGKIAETYGMPHKYLAGWSG